MTAPRYAPQHRQQRHAPQHRQRPHIPQHLMPVPPRSWPGPSVKAVGVAMAVTVTGVGSVAGMAPSAGAAQFTGAPTGLRATAADTYTVRAGDTLEMIAERLGTTVSVLATTNGISNPNLIFIGRVLRLGAAPSEPAATAPRQPASVPKASPVPAPTPAPPVASSYVVRSGDTLGAVAARFATTVSALVQLNHLADPNLVFVGQVLALGGTVRTAPPLPVATPRRPPSAPVGAPIPARTLSGDYTVRAGDTLGAVAARFATTVPALVEANHLVDPNLIFVGEVLSTREGVLLSINKTTPLTPAPAPTRAPAPAPAPASSSTPSGAAQVALRVALAQVGKPYQWAGAGPASYDCSGLVLYAYAAVGITLVHYTVDQYNDTSPITKAQLRPGDLVFYNTGAGAQPGHVAIYIGGGNVVASNNVGTLVQTQPLSWDGTIMGFRRVP